MPKMKKADLEKRITELEEEFKKYQNWLMEAKNKNNKLIDEKETQLETLPSYIQMKSHIERLELINKANAETIASMEVDKTSLQDKVSSLNDKIKQLQNSIKNQTAISDTIHNSRGAGRKPKSKELIQKQLSQISALLEQRLKEKEICNIMDISRATFYRLKRLL